MTQNNLRSAICFKKFKKWRRLKKFNMLDSLKSQCGDLVRAAERDIVYARPACACARTRSRGTHV
jgi:hypothetical protein